MPRSFSDYINAYCAQRTLSAKAQAEILAWLTNGGDPTEEYTGSSRVIAEFCKWARDYWNGVYSASIAQHRLFPFVFGFLEDYAKTAEGGIYRGSGKGLPSTRNQNARTILRALDALIPATQPVDQINWTTLLSEALEPNAEGACLLTEAGCAAAGTSTSRNLARYALDNLGPQMLEYARLRAAAAANPAPQGGLKKPETVRRSPKPNPAPETRPIAPRLSKCGRVYLPESGVATFTTTVGGMEVPVQLDLTDPKVESAWAQEVYGREVEEGEKLLGTIKHASIPRDPGKRAKVLAALRTALALMD